MARNFALFMLAAVLSSTVTAEYLITTPYQYRVGQNTVAVQLFGPKSCEVEVRLRTRRGNVIASASGNFTAGQKGNLTLRIPEEYVDSRRVYYRNYFDLDARVCGVKTESRSVFTKRERRNNIFIQTDKPIYKPGQKIRMRILSFDKDFKPTGKTIDTVRVVVSSSRIKQWNDVKLEDGIASLELQLSKEPVLGKYAITAFIGNVRKSQTIEVAKYVLPKYEVKITPPIYMALDQKEFTTAICAKYTYGKNVKGTLNAVLCLEHKRYWSWRRRRPDQGFTKCQNITKQIDGCTNIVLARDELNVAQITNLWNTRFYVNAQVTETLTGITMKSKAQNQNFKKSSVVMSFSGTSNKFKPGLPFKYVLKVTRPDGSPATGSNVLVTISRGWYSNEKFYNKTFVVTNGLITDSLDDGTYNARSLVFEAKLLDKNPYPVSKNFFSYGVVSSHTANPWYSPSFSYLEILKTQNTPARINSEASLTVRYTVRNNTGEKVDFQYTIMCKGNIVNTGMHTQFHHYIHDENPTTTARPTTPRTTVTVNVTNATHSRLNHTTVIPPLVRIIDTRSERWRPKPAPVKKLNTKPVVETFSIQFPVTREMMPSCGVMVYYVRQDKEVVADSIQFDVEDKFENQVSMRFEENERKPGEKTNLILEATPGSRVALVAVDKSVHLLRAGNELTKEKIRPYGRTYREKAYNRNPKCNHWHPWWRGKRSSPPFWGWRDRPKYDDASEAFNVAGIIFLSNLSIFTKPCHEPNMMMAEIRVLADEECCSCIHLRFKY